MNQEVSREEMERLKLSLGEWIRDIRQEQQNIYEWMVEITEEHQNVLKSIAKMYQMVLELRIEATKLRLKLLEQPGGK